ncbi:hypothetical protein K2F54_15635 [Cryobacterium sp. 1639]|uniref:hypothetical protein n=1 Tax=Cryobacterium inferilacus TaxID=2866629 RepID=UPI001C72B05D|nr:hypothetical protein [Cryobacterium sp. 1639]MBX0301405.1 hypothetical protein [Cryobacterium sp. 1639]
MKKWSFTTVAVIAFVLSASSISALIINALTGMEFSGMLLPYAIVALVAGGAMSLRAHLLWLGNANKSSPGAQKRPKG